MESGDMSRRIYWDQQPSHDLSLFPNRANNATTNEQRHRPNQTEKNKRLKICQDVDLGMDLQQPRPQPKACVCCESDDLIEADVGGGGHIGKDQRPRVPKDRRVRLSPDTAMQFFDLQDRLGYSRPSRAIDWLIAKARSAIDKLANPPPKFYGSRFQAPNCSVHPEASPTNFQGCGPGFAPGSASPTEDLCLSLYTSEQTASNRASSPNHYAPSEVVGFETAFGTGTGPGSSRFRIPVAWNNGGGAGFVFAQPPAFGWPLQSSLLISPSPTSLHGWDDPSIACGAAAFGSEGRVPAGVGRYGFGSDDKPPSGSFGSGH